MRVSLSLHNSVEWVRKNRNQGVHHNDLGNQGSEQEVAKKDEFDQIVERLIAVEVAHCEKEFELT